MNVSLRKAWLMPYLTSNKSTTLSPSSWLCLALFWMRCNWYQGYDAAICVIFFLHTSHVYCSAVWKPFLMYNLVRTGLDCVSILSGLAFPFCDGLLEWLSFCLRYMAQAQFQNLFCIFWNICQIYFHSWWFITLKCNWKKLFRSLSTPCTSNAGHWHIAIGAFLCYQV